MLLLWGTPTGTLGLLGISAHGILFQVALGLMNHHEAKQAGQDRTEQPGSKNCMEMLSSRSSEDYLGCFWAGKTSNSQQTDGNTRIYAAIDVVNNVEGAATGEHLLGNIFQI